MSTVFQTFSMEPDWRNADAAFKAGLDALDGEREQAAIKGMMQAVAAHPRDARLWQILGLLHRSQLDLGSALQAFEKASKLAPKDVRIAHGYAQTTLEAGLSAVALFEKAFALLPTYADLLIGLAAARFSEGDLDGAKKILSDRLKTEPLWLAGHSLLARMRWMSGERDEFTRSLENALALAPQNVALWRQLIVIHMQGKHFDKALSIVERAKSATGVSRDFAAEEAICLAETWQLEAADKAFAPVLTTGNITVAIYAMRHALRMKRPEQVEPLAAPFRNGSNMHMLYPYLSLAWRLLGDPRWAWLEGDPRFIGVYDLADQLEPFDALVNRLRSLHVTDGEPLDQSVRAGSQTDGPLFSRIDPEIALLRTVIRKAVAKHIATLPEMEQGHPLLGLPRDRTIRFAGSWSVRLGGGGFHTNHIHPAGWMSSAFYAALPEPRAGDDPQSGWLSLGCPEHELGLDLEPIRIVEPRRGRLVLFPSTMWHGTIPFREGERLTVAFDIARPV